MAGKSSQLQIRVTVLQKRRLRRLASAAGQDVSAYVLAQVLPDTANEFAAIVARVRKGGTAQTRFALAALHDFLVALPPAELAAATANADLARLAPFEANYIAAMVEHTAVANGLVPPAWTASVQPLMTPYFASSLGKLRLHLMRAAPVAFKRRNLFVDSVVGARV